MFCCKCGKQLNVRDSFCIFCGHSVKQSEKYQTIQIHHVYVSGCQNADLILMHERGMNEIQKYAFRHRVASAQKSPTTAILLALFLGGLGAHHFYMRNPGVAILYILFCWTFIPSIVSFFEAFCLTKRTELFNRAEIARIAESIKRNK